MSRSRPPVRAWARYAILAGCAIGALRFLTPPASRSVAANQNQTAAAADQAGPIIWPATRTLADAGGQQRELDKLRGPQGVVVVFLSTECPISRAYIPA